MGSRARITVIAVSLLSLAGCSSHRESPGLELQAQDYQTARSQFKTRLLQSGPAPQPAEAFPLPKGVTVVNYSKELGLKALVGPLPRDGKKHPAVLFLHGGFAMDGSDWEASAPYRDAGFIVMTPLLRGENGQKGSYSLFYNEVSDVLAAAEALAALPSVDKSHIYLAGHSVGGTLTLLAALSSKLFRAATAFSGACDAIAWSEGQSELVPFDPKDKREFQLRSPIAFATSFQCPTRIYYGTQEALFAGMSQRTAELAKAKKLDVEAIAVPGDHFTALDGEMAQSIAFFQSH